MSASRPARTNLRTILSSALLLAGCASKTDGPPRVSRSATSTISPETRTYDTTLHELLESGRVISDEEPTPPRWLNSPEEAFPSDEGKVMCAVGSCRAGMNPFLARTHALADAEVKMGRKVSSEIGGILKRSATSVDYPTPEQAASKQTSAPNLRDYTDTVLKMAKPVAYWTSPEGAVYCLLGLRMDDWTEAANAVSQERKEGKSDGP